MSTDDTFLTILNSAPGPNATADDHLKYAAKMLAEGNRQMVTRLTRQAGSTTPPHAFAIAEAHTNLANAKILRGAL